LGRNSIKESSKNICNQSEETLEQNLKAKLQFVTESVDGFVV